MALTIKGRAYELSPRIALDVLELASAVEKREKSDDLTNVLSMVKVVADSLKATAKHLPWYRKLRYVRFLRGGGLNYILRSLTSQEVVEAYLAVMESEGVKKKELMRAVLSGATLHAGSSPSSSASDSKT